MDNEPDLTNNIVSLTLAELVKSKALVEKKKLELEKAVTIEDLKKDPEPEPQPEPEEKSMGPLEWMGVQ